MRNLYHFYVYLRGQMLDLLQIHQLLVVPEHNLVLILHFELQGFQFNFHRYPTWDQLKLTTYSLPCWTQNKFKLLIMLPKSKALLEGFQQLYTKNDRTKGLVSIKRRYGYHNREKLVTRVLVDFYQYIAYLTTIHRPLKCDRCFKAITSAFFNSHPNFLSTLDILRKYNEGGAWLPRDSERLKLNVFNQLLSIQLMELIGTKDI